MSLVKFEIAGFINSSIVLALRHRSLFKFLFLSFSERTTSRERCLGAIFGFRDKSLTSSLMVDNPESPIEFSGNIISQSRILSYREVGEAHHAVLTRKPSQ